MQGRAIPHANRTNRTHHIGFLKRASAVLAAADCGLMVVIEADQQDPSVPLAAADIDRQRIAVLADADRGSGLASALGLFDRRADILAMRADMAGRTVDHDLRRVGAVAESVSVTVLAGGRRFQRE